MKKIILYGAGYYGEMAMNVYGPKVACFCDNRHHAYQGKYAGVPVISFEEMKEIHKDYDVIITPASTKAREEIAEKCYKNGIAFSFFEPMSHLLHFYGDAKAISYEFESGRHDSWVARTIDMYRELFRVFYADFTDKIFDIWIYVSDLPLTAYDVMKRMKLEHIFAYCTTWTIAEYVIPIPDHYSCFREDAYFYKDVSPTACRQAAASAWEDSRAYWRGTLSTNLERNWLYLLGKNYPNYLQIESVSSDDAYVPMTNGAKYKYLVDIRGVGWTDRVKILLQLGRPLLLVDRPYKEWYFEQLVPMKHYVPVKEDLSDLLEKIKYLDEHPEFYREIVNNALEFSDNVLNKKVLTYLKQVTLKYGVVTKLESKNWQWDPNLYRSGSLL